MVSNNYFISCARCYPLPTKIGVVFARGEDISRHPTSRQPAIFALSTHAIKFSAYFESRANQALLKFF